MVSRSQERKFKSSAWRVVKQKSCKKHQEYSRQMQVLLEIALETDVELRITPAVIGGHIPPSYSSGSPISSLVCGTA